MRAFESVSTWRQPTPSPASPERTALVTSLASRVAGLGESRLRVAVDGRTGAGKTSFGHELAAALRGLGRPTMRACMDDFKHPWRHAREHSYDRLTGEGYYRNAYDFASARDLLLIPAGPAGSGTVALCGHDPLTGEDHRATVIHAPPDAVLVVDSVFAFRPEYNDYWDFRVWLEVETETAVRRGVARDTPTEGADEAARVHRGRYHAAQAIYIAEVHPVLLADVVVDNTDFRNPQIIDILGRT